MKNIKKSLLILAAIILVMPTFLTNVSAENNNGGKTETESSGSIATKDEVVYATLSTAGDQKEIYVVNMLDVTKAGIVTDYGDYSNIKNLTGFSDLKQSTDQVKIDAPKGKFYYQGNMDDAVLPWDFTIEYYLDGEKTSPEELAGKDGQLQIKIKTAANEDVDQTFFNNYLLQVSVTFDSEKTNNIKTDAGMIANAGKNKQVTFTVMPEQEEELAVEADVEDIELDGIDITGVPSTMSIDAPDTDEMTSDIMTLTDAIADVNDGVAELKNGVSELNDGASALKSGSQKYNNGISELDNSSAELVDGSKNIDQALEKMSNSLQGMKDMDLSELEQLTGGLSEISKGLGETADGLTALKNNYSRAYNALDKAMTAIPSDTIPEKDIQALYQSGADKETIDKLVATYTAARTAKGTYNEVKQGFDAVDSTLDNVIGSLKEMAGHISSITGGLTASSGKMDAAEGLFQLKDAIADMSKNYKKFHAGLVEYTGGVHQLSNSYQELDNGIGELSSGTGELENGTAELYKGTTKLERSTSDLPDEMTKEIDDMIAEYDKSDFDVVSFVSPENESVYSVQFVLKTESIEKEEPEKNKEQEEKEKGFWERFKDLFS